MKKNLEDYIKIYNNFISKEICNQTVKELNLIDKKSWQEHSFYNRKTKKHVSISGNKELSVSYGLNISTNKVIMDLIWKALFEYIKKLNFHWFDGWQGYSHVRFNKYSKSKKMAEHCDHIAHIFDGERKGIPTLSVLGILNDEYKGGEFIMFKDKEIKLKAGDILIFPSIFLYPHKVEPVVKGTRYSFISWAW
jgi:hypothetical protein